MNFIIALFISSATIVFVLEPLLSSMEEQPVEVECDYEIDLKQDYIIVYSKGGNIDTIPHGKLDEFVERDNM